VSFTASPRGGLAGGGRGYHSNAVQTGPQRLAMQSWARIPPNRPPPDMRRGGRVSGNARAGG